MVATLLRLSNRLKEHEQNSSHAPPGVRFQPNQVVASNQSGDLWAGPSLTWNSVTLMLAGQLRIASDASNYAGFSVDANGNLTIQPTGTSGNGYVSIYTAGAGGSSSAILGYSAGERLLITSDALLYQSGGGESFRCTGGNVGIGTTTPGTQNLPGINLRTLMLGGDIRPQLLFDSTDSTQESRLLADGAGLYIDIAGHGTATNNIIVFRNSNANSDYTMNERMRITSTGNVGIGWTSPTAILDANGVIRARGVDWVSMTLTGSTTCTLGTNSPASGTTPVTWKRETFINSANEITVGYTPVFL